MDAPRMKVSCTVDNCKYNKSHMCYADSIKVDAMGDHHADTRDGTCCSTFIEDH